MKKLILILFGIIFIISCKKDEDKEITVTGEIKDPTGAAISGVRVSLQGTILSGGTYNTGFSEMAYATTDAGGKYEIKTKWQVVSKYRIIAIKTNFFDYKTELTSNTIPAGESYTNNILVYPIAWIKLNVVNTSGCDSNDVISYRISSPPSQVGFDCCSNEYFIGKGQFFSAATKCKSIGNSNAIFEWSVQKSGAIHTYQHNMFCVAFDTTTFNLNY